MPEFAPPTPLRSDHDLSRFDCGKQPINEFLTLHALDKQNAMLSRTYVVTMRELVVGYYTLAHVSIPQPHAPKKFGRGMPTFIPAILMARFAVDQTFQGLGLGRSLFADAIQRTWAVMKNGAAPVRLFVVDAKDAEALAFYKRFDMIAAPSDPMRLFLFYKTLRDIFEEQP